MRRASLYWVLAAAVALAACGAIEDGPGGWAEGGKGEFDNQRGGRKGDDGRVASHLAKFYDFTIKGKLLADSWVSYDPEQAVKEQLFFTVGQLNGENSVGRMDNVKITVFPLEADPDGTDRKLVKYEATLMVAWAPRSGNELPEGGYTFKLPYDISSAGKGAFVEAYSKPHSFDANCVEENAHDVNVGSMWYYFRPNRDACPFAQSYNVTAGEPELKGDEGKPKIVVIKTTDIKPSEQQTEGKYPEFEKIWEDDKLQVVAVFGKYEDDGTAIDAGVRGYRSFVRQMSDLLKPSSDGAVQSLETFVDDQAQPIPSDVGDGHPDISFKATLSNGKKVWVFALLINSVTNPGRPNFFGNEGRYGMLTTEADLIGYNGHSGLGQNIRMMASQGHWRKDQYVIVYLNGCVSFAYVDNALIKAHKEKNRDPEDVLGTKYIDIMVNAMPSYFSNMDDSMYMLTRGLMSYGASQKAIVYEDLMRDLPSSQVVLVLGEEDNAFEPGDDPLEPENICRNNCNKQPEGMSCYCDKACSQVNYQDCCQDAAGTKGATRTYVDAVCP